MGKKRKAKKPKFLTPTGEAALRALFEANPLPEGMTAQDIREKNIKQLCRIGKQNLCPVSMRSGATYCREITWRQALALIGWWHKWKDFNYHRLPDLIKEMHERHSGWQMPNILRGGEFAKLILWGFIEEKPKEPGANKKNSGSFRITESGRDWVLREVVAPRFIFTYEKLSILEASMDDCIPIDVSLGVEFDYQGLIGNI